MGSNSLSPMAIPAVARPAVAIPSDSIFIGWRSATADGIDVYGDAARKWARITTIADRVDNPTALGVSHDGFLYSANQATNYVSLYRLSDDGQYAGKLDKMILHPYMLALDSQGSIAVGNVALQAHTITVFPFDRSDQAYSITDDIHNPGALTFSKSGELYVANRGDSSISVYALYDSKPLAVIKDGVSVPDAVAVDGSGKLYVANFRSENVTVYEPVSHLLVGTIPTKKENPRALLVAGDHLYIAAYTYTNSVTDYDIASGKSTRIVDGVLQPRKVVRCSRTYVCVMNRDDISVYQADKLVTRIKPAHRPISLASGE